MLVTDIRDVLLASSTLMAFLGSRTDAVDLVDVDMGVKAPYVTFNVMKTDPLRKGNLCDPTALGPQLSEVMFTPWAPSAAMVEQLNDAVRVAVLGSVLKPTFAGFRQWAREPDTNLLTRGQVFTIQHTL